MAVLTAVVSGNPNITGQLLQDVLVPAAKQLSSLPASTVTPSSPPGLAGARFTNDRLRPGRPVGRTAYAAESSERSAEFPVSGSLVYGPTSHPGGARAGSGGISISSSILEKVRKDMEERLMNLSRGHSANLSHEPSLHLGENRPSSRGHADSSKPPQGPSGVLKPRSHDLRAENASASGPGIPRGSSGSTSRPVRDSSVSVMDEDSSSKELGEIPADDSSERRMPGPQEPDYSGRKPPISTAGSITPSKRPHEVSPGARKKGLFPAHDPRK